MLSLCLGLPGETRCNIGVFDLSGRKVGTMVDAALTAGDHTFTLSVSDLSPGTYFICGNAGDLIVSERTVLIR